MTLGLFSSLKAVSMMTGNGRYGAVTVGKNEATRKALHHSITPFSKACVAEEARALPHTGMSVNCLRAVFIQAPLPADRRRCGQARGLLAPQIKLGSDRAGAENLIKTEP